MGEDRHDASMIDAPALSPDPAISAPAPREVSFGLVAGVAPRGTRQIIVRVGKHDVAQEPLRGRTFSLNVPMQAGRGRGSRDGRGRPESPLDERRGARLRPPARLRPTPALVEARSIARPHGSLARRAARRDGRRLRAGPPHRPRRLVECAGTLSRRLDAQARDRGHGHALARQASRTSSTELGAPARPHADHAPTTRRRTSSRSGSRDRPPPGRRG